LQRNSFFAHHENIPLGLLSDSDEEVRSLAVNKILKIRKNSNKKAVRNKTTIRRFHLPKINLKAKQCHQMVSLDEITELPAIRYFNEEKLNQLKTNALKLMHPCHNQAVEHVKLVSEVASQVMSFEKHDGYIQQKICPRKLLKQLDTKSQFMSK